MQRAPRQPDGEERPQEKCGQTQLRIALPLEVQGRLPGRHSRLPPARDGERGDRDHPLGPDQCRPPARLPARRPPAVRPDQGEAGHRKARAAAQQEGPPQAYADQHQRRQRQVDPADVEEAPRNQHRHQSHEVQDTLHQQMEGADDPRHPRGRSAPPPAGADIRPRSRRAGPTRTAPPVRRRRAAATAAGRARPRRARGGSALRASGRRSPAVAAGHARRVWRRGQVRTPRPSPSARRRAAPGRRRAGPAPDRE